MDDDMNLVNLVRTFNAWSPEPLLCSQGGIPYNKFHLDARDAEIARLRAALDGETSAHQVCVEMRNDAETEVERLRAALKRIFEICHIPTAPGMKAYTHFQRDFNEIRTLAKIGCCEQEVKND